MENISEKITEEGMLIPNSITWAPFLLITIHDEIHRDLKS